MWRTNNINPFPPLPSSLSPLHPPLILSYHRFPNSPPLDLPYQRTPTPIPPAISPSQFNPSHTPHPLVSLRFYSSHSHFMCNRHSQLQCSSWILRPPRKIHSRYPIFVEFACAAFCDSIYDLVCVSWDWIDCVWGN